MDPAFPRFAGEIVTDPTAVARLVTGFGGRPALPRAVLRPETLDDVVTAVGFAASRGIRVAARGQGHCTGTQATAPDGLVVDLRTLRNVHAVEPGAVTTDAGATWADIVAATLPDQVPPTLPGWLHLSVGGTLAVGGIGAESFRTGAQVDNVLELLVVTGAGELVRCSRDCEPALFDAVRAGLGRVGITVRARLALVPAPSTVRTWSLRYRDLEAFVADLLALADTDRFDQVSGSATEGLACSLVKYAGDDDLRGLSADRADDPVDVPFATFLRRTDALVASWQQNGLWDAPHVWLDLFVPDDGVVPIVRSLDPGDLGGGLVLLTPIRTDRLRAPLLRVPRSRRAILLDIDRNAIPAGRAPALAAANLALYRGTPGATLYPIGTVPLTPSEWRAHLGDAFAAAKQRFDPREVLP